MKHKTFSRVDELFFMYLPQSVNYPLLTYTHSEVAGPKMLLNDDKLFIFPQNCVNLVTLQYLSKGFSFLLGTANVR